MSPAARVLPDSKSLTLHLTHPTEEEKLATWTLNSASWSGALNQLDYLEREQHLTEAPLARNGGITHWILVEKELPPNERPILGSCETLRKRALVSQDGIVTDVISHGIGSVFCNPHYRGRGYASRMMRELGQRLRTWQTDLPEMKCAFSALWSDIGKTYYAGHGWRPFPSSHVEFPSVSFIEGKSSSLATALEAKDLQTLCEQDELLIRRNLKGTRDGKTHVVLIPDHDHMQWHHAREDFLCQKLYGKEPRVRGAIIGQPGHRIWAIWTRSFYGPLEAADSRNILHILRLVVEDEVPASSFSGQAGGPMYEDNHLDELAQKLKAIIQIAQAEAVEWKLLHVELWNPTLLTQALIQKTDLQHRKIEREKNSIPSLMWYGEGGGNMDELEWLGNEKFGWC